ncbi:DMT family transporter [Marimonas lutisalis]|uniref:DMT family transporter n=1 Tax=Marimonas lutisalis TaxID=2545756 RepID=UPI0010F8681E|nr:EamA family transporter [Marimonas lutisalis]
MRAALRPIDFAMGLSVALVWGMGIVFAKAAIAHFPPILLMSLRFTVTALALVWFVRPPVGHLWRLFVIAIVAAAIQYSLTFTGLKGLDASVTALVVQVEVPFLVLIGALFLGETPGMRKWIGIAMAFVGVAFIAGASQVSVAWGSVLLVLAGCFAWAVGQAMVRALKDIDGLTVTAWIAVFAAPQLLVMSLIFESGHVAAIGSAGWVVWAAVAYLGLIMTALGYGMWYSLIRRNPVSLVAPFLLMLPVFSVLGGILFLGESLGPRTLLGGVIVIAGVAFIVVERAPRITMSEV